MATKWEKNPSLASSFSSAQPQKLKALEQADLGVW